MGRCRILTMLGAACFLAMAGQARAYGLFTCYDPAGNEVCVVDTGTRTGFVPSDVCNTTCPACAGRCNAARRFPERSGHWVETWHGTPGMNGGNNRLVPGPIRARTPGPWSGTGWPGRKPRRLPNPEPNRTNTTSSSSTTGPPTGARLPPFAQTRTGLDRVFRRKRRINLCFRKRGQRSHGFFYQDQKIMEKRHAAPPGGYDRQGGRDQPCAFRNSPHGTRIGTRFRGSRLPCPAAGRAHTSRSRTVPSGT